MSRDLIRLMQSLFPSSLETPREGNWQPSVDVYQTKRGWLLKYDLAGVCPDEVKLLVQGRRLTLRGTRRDWVAEQQNCCCYRMEISYNRFERTVELPCDLESKPMETEYRHGMLLVHIHTETEK